MGIGPSGEKDTIWRLLEFDADDFRIVNGGALSLLVERESRIETTEVFAPGYWFRLDIEKRED